MVNYINDGGAPLPGIYNSYIENTGGPASGIYANYIEDNNLIGVLPVSFWTSGYWDFRTLTGNLNDVIPISIASSVGNNTLTVEGAPTLDNVAIAGRNTVVLQPATKQYFRCDSLAAGMQAGLKWVRAIRFRVQSSAVQTLFAAGHSTISTNDYLRIQQLLNVVTIVSASTGGGVVSRTCSIDLQFDEHVLIVWSDGVNLHVSVDGVIDTLSNAVADTHAATFDRFGVGAYLSTTAVETMTGFIQFFAAADGVDFSASQASLLNNQLRSGDFTLQRSVSPTSIDIGDSITETSVFCTYVAGIREYRLQAIVDHGMSIRAVGIRENGVMPDRVNAAQGGANMATIQANAHAALITNGIAPDLGFLMMGTNDLGSGSTSTWLPQWRTSATAIYSDAIAKKPAFKFWAAAIPPFKGTLTPQSTNQPLFNAGLQAAGTGEFDLFLAAHPGALIKGDASAALGGVWSAPLYGNGDGTETTHPNETGCQLIGGAQWLDCATAIRSLCGTIVPLTATITSPTSGKSLVVGTAYTITVAVSRYPSTVIIKKGSTVIGSATMNKRVGTLSYTPVLGDIGALNLTATVTDSIDSTTATSPAIPVTILASAPTSPITIWGAAVLRWSNANISSSGSGMSDLSGNSLDYTGACSINPSNSTINNLRTVKMNGFGQQLDCSLNLPQPGTTPTTHLLIARIPSFQTAVGIATDSAAGGPRLITLDGTDVFWNAGSSVITTATYGSWQLYSAEFSNNSSDKFSAGTHAVTGNAGNVASAAGRRLGGPGQAFEILEEVFLNRKATAPELTQYYSYIDSLTANAVIHL